MGNQGSVYDGRELKNRSKTIDYDERYETPVRKLRKSRREESFDAERSHKQRIRYNQSYDQELSSQQTPQDDPPPKNHTILPDHRHNYSERLKRRGENDGALDQLSQRNEELRRQLKRINDQLNEELKKKKFVPKKKKIINDDEEERQQRQNVGLKKQLDNAYKQIEMYKRTIENLKKKEQGDRAELKLKYLENQITQKDAEINKYIKKIEGVKNIKVKQQSQIEKDINDDLKDGVASYKLQAKALKKRLSQFGARDRAREMNYKKQQAYVCDLEKKLRDLNGDYFPELKKNIQAGKTGNKKITSSDMVNRLEFLEVAKESNELKVKHQEYYRRIDALIQAKNKSIEEKNDINGVIAEKQRRINELKSKLDKIKVIIRPSKGGIFGGSGTGVATEDQYDIDDQIEQILKKEKMEQDQNKFDVKHLLVNLPKPPRKRPEEISGGRNSDGSSSDYSYEEGGGGISPNGKKRKKKPKRKPEIGGIVVTSEKAEPKKWGHVQTRIEERGKHYKGQLNFEDRMQFDSDVQPRIVGLNVWVNKNNTILGLQAVYLNKDELRYGVKSSEAADGAIKRLDLQTPDYVKNITFTMGPEGFIESLTLFSKEGRTQKFGNKRNYDESYNFGLAGNERPFFLLGSSSLYEKQPRLSSLGMEICIEEE